MITKISHIGIAAKNLQMAQHIFEQILGFGAGHAQRVDDQEVDIVSFQIDDTGIELTSATSDESPVAKFIQKRGEGIHHIAFEVDDLHAELARLKSLGIKLIDEEPRAGANNYSIAFLHPKSTNGILIELCEKMK